MVDDRDQTIKRLREKIRKLEATLKIVADHHGKTETRMRRQFEVVAETIPVPLAIIKNAGEIAFANQSAHDTFGYTQADFNNVRAPALYQNSEDRQLFLDALKMEKEIQNFRVELKKADGSAFPASLFSRRINFDGQDCILTIMHDLTDVMNLEKQLRHTQKMEAIGTLTGGIAHDFNNILSIIFGYTELTVELLDAPEDQQKKENLENVLKAARRAKAMIMQMMAFCKQVEKAKTPFNIAAVVSEVVEMMANLTPSDIDVRPDIRDKRMIVTGDPTQIHQVVTNLITNAVQALAEKGGRIEVTLEKSVLSKEQCTEIGASHFEPGEFAQISIKDNGPGIDNAIIQNIFDPFFTTKPMGKGSGMGLAVVHGIVRSHNGCIQVESEAGQGVVFHCYFPLAAQNDETARPDLQSEKLIKGDETILLADDETMVLNVCTNILQRLGYHVTSCDGGASALAHFESNPENFDLVITDNIMPDMNGLELSQKILQIRPDIPIIMAAGAMPKKESELKKQGVRAFIQKPFDRTRIQLLIREVLDAAKTN